jgi:hypothetical protein
MQKINPKTGHPLGMTGPKSRKKAWQDWAWKISPVDAKKTIAFIQKNVKKQVEASVKQSPKKRKVEYVWELRVKVYLTPPATKPRPGGAGTGDPPTPPPPPPPRLT